MPKKKKMVVVAACSFAHEHIDFKEPWLKYLKYILEKEHGKIIIHDSDNK